MIPVLGSLQLLTTPLKCTICVLSQLNHVIGLIYTILPLLYLDGIGLHRMHIEYLLVSLLSNNM